MNRKSVSLSRPKSNFSQVDPPSFRPSRGKKMAVLGFKELEFCL